MTPALLAELERFGVVEPRPVVRKETSRHDDVPAWKPASPGEEPPF